MDQRFAFILDLKRGNLTMSELCARYGVSRVTGYSWLKRFNSLGLAGLQERSHAAHRVHNATPEEVVNELLAVRFEHPSWGAKKALKVVGDRRPDLALPARSTVCDIFERSGLVDRMPRRRPLGHPGPPKQGITVPNECWSADHKGWFRTLDGHACHPLTVTDNHSRYLLCCHGEPQISIEGAKKQYERLFREFGLPERIRTDNGTPFASTGLARLSRLSAWCIRLGVMPELIVPGRPQQNGRHERMHRTLKDETTRPPQQNLAAQQRRFDDFAKEFNNERPHEALNQDTPAQHYQRSPRQMPAKLPALEYPGHFERRIVGSNGGIRWRKGYVGVSSALIGQWVGLEPVDDAEWDVFYGPLRIGRLHEKKMQIEDKYGKVSSGSV
jgi:transposase InsO family protein